ncbi:MAG: hypothetical protein WCQ95_14895 [Bacteroidota bacterium]
MKKCHKHSKAVIHAGLNMIFVKKKQTFAGLANHDEPKAELLIFLLIA